MIPVQKLDQDTLQCCWETVLDDAGFVQRKTADFPSDHCKLMRVNFLYESFWLNVRVDFRANGCEIRWGLRAKQRGREDELHGVHPSENVSSNIMS